MLSKDALVTDSERPSAQTPQTDVPALLRLLVRNAPEGAILAFCSIRQKKLRPAFFPATLEGAKECYKTALAHDKAGRDCYVQCTLLKHIPPLRNGKQGRGTKEDVLGGNDLYIDIDRPEKPNGGLTPTILVSSGRGWHMHFGLRAFVDDPAKIEELNKKLAAKYQADDCWDASRLLRIPGTRNHKDPKNPKPVVETLNKKLFTAEQLTQALAGYEARTAEDTPDDSKWSMPEAEPITDEDLAKLDQKLLRDLTTKKQKDRSSVDYNICMRLMSVGWSVGQLRTAMTNPEWVISSKVLDNGNLNVTYLRNTLKKADSKLKQSGIGPRPKALLAKTIYDKRRGTDGKLVIGQPDADWCEPCVQKLVDYGITFRRNSEDHDNGFVGTPEGMLETDGPRFDAWLQDVSGYTKESHIHSILKAWLQVEACRRTSQPVKLRPWVVLERPKKDQPPRLIMAADLGGYEIREVTLTNPITEEVYPNGDKELLLRTSNRLHRALPGEKSDLPLARLREVFTDQLACSDISREILTAYLLAAPLVRGFGIVTLPLLYLTGTAGSGKTQTLKLISTYFHGTHKVLGDSTVASMYRGAAAEIFVPFDDYDKLSDAVKAFILSTTTGAERQKSDGKTAVVSQDLHVLLAFTSTKELQDEPLRRRAIRIEINKARWHGMGHFSEEHWKRINEIRDSCWWAWLRVLSRTPKLSELMANFDARTQETEKLITVDANRPLAGFLTLLYECLKIAGSSLDMRPSSMLDWLRELKLNDAEEVFERHDIINGLDTLFDTVLDDPAFEGALVEEGGIARGILSAVMDSGYQLRYRYDPRDSWLELKGTTAQWWNTLRYTTRGGYRQASAISVGHDFKALIGESPDHSEDPKTSKVYTVGRYRVQHITNAGASGTSRGWKVAVFVPKKT